MKRLDYKVLITTSGTGSRLQELTKEKNKGLLEIQREPILSRIIKSYSRETSFVITTGYKGAAIKDYLQRTFPDHDMTFVRVEKFKGDGSSLGYSMLQVKDQLQCPFIFHCNDTLVIGDIPEPIANWNGGSKGSDSANQTTQAYSSFVSKDGEVVTINPKGAKTYDYFHIGLVGIHDYKKFWEYLEDMYKKDPNDQTLNDVPAINLMITNGNSFKVKEFAQWFDTGNIEGIEFAQKHLK